MTGPATNHCRRRRDLSVRPDPGRRSVQQYRRDAPPVDLRWRLIPKDFLRMQEEQLRILRATIPLLKTGGVLVYSTCSIEPEENEEVVRCDPQEFPFLKLVEQVSLASVPGRIRWRLRREIDRELA